LNHCSSSVHRYWSKFSTKLLILALNNLIKTMINILKETILIIQECPWIQAKINHLCLHNKRMNNPEVTKMTKVYLSKTVNLVWTTKNFHSYQDKSRMTTRMNSLLTTNASTHKVSQVIWHELNTQLSRGLLKTRFG